MSDTLPSVVPSLARAFEPERKALQSVLTPELSAAQVVGEARRALDRAGTAFTHEVSDPHLQKSGLWLLEMVKAGAGILDRATGADVVWSERAARPKREWAGRGLFYGAAGVFAVAGLVQGSMTVILASGVLAAFRFFDPKDWGHLLDKIPFRKKQIALEDLSGRRMEAEAFIRADAHGFITQLVEALKTADHILLRLAEPETQTHWRDNPRLTGMLQSLLEAQEAGDGDFALTLINQEMKSVLAGEGIELITYSKKTKDMFDILPAIGETETKMAAPALVSEGRVLRRGTVWQSES
ncbi:MAG: hypothetical protein ABJN69_00960 [Hellea sp.]